MVEDMDIYGTCLWHLKKKNELSVLGKELEEINRTAPQTWYSLFLMLGVLLETISRIYRVYYRVLQDHDAAINAFKRAVQIDPLFTYAHTLVGHEHLSNDDLDQSTASFRLALQTNARHYNAL